MSNSDRFRRVSSIWLRAIFRLLASFLAIVLFVGSSAASAAGHSTRSSGQFARTQFLPAATKVPVEQRRVDGEGSFGSVKEATTLVSGGKSERIADSLVGLVLTSGTRSRPDQGDDSSLFMHTTASRVGAVAYRAGCDSGLQRTSCNAPDFYGFSENAGSRSNVWTAYNYDALQLFRVSQTLMATKPRVCPGNSFTADTHVLMADGTTKRIEDVAVGDIVLATDPKTGKSGPHTVTALIIGEGEKRLIDIVVETNDGPKTIAATWNHDFWVDDQGQWLRADRLDRGDDLLAPTGERVTVVSSSERTAYRRVHNLTVAGVHSYYVLAGRQPVLVHNDGDEYPSPLPTQKQGKTQPLTNAQAKDLAEYNGYRDTGRTLRGEKIFTDGKNFIVQDTTSHNGGTWKIAKSERALGSKTTRTATTDALLEPIGC